MKTLVYTARLSTTHVNWDKPLRVAYPSMPPEEVERILRNQEWVKAYRLASGIEWPGDCWKLEEVDFAELAERPRLRARAREALRSSRAE